MMPTLLVAFGLVLLVAFALLVRWWFSGGGAQALSFDPAAEMAAFPRQFPEDKYKALCRLLDTAESRVFERKFSAPADLIRRLEAGRRKVLSGYLAELDEEFQRILWLYAHAQATGFAARPSAVREIAAGWWRFRTLSRRARRSSQRGELTCDEVIPLVNEVRGWIGKLIPNSDSAR